ncbi:MAG TPA: HAD family phosphatase [Sandaracinaceae bacterium LLY-WYZ-13_1]|nr:HAD family phosphatase [Sandaracinaceae bacterium LLY-WYZ-13_1]
MIDALLLDVMGTLVRDPFHREMPAFFGMSLDELLAQKHPDAWVRFEHGELSEEAFLERFFADGRPFDRRGFVEHVRRAYAYLEGIEPLLEALRARGVPMHALSNYPCWYRLIEAELGLSRYLDWSFVSCETGVRKPDPEAYRGAARALSLPPERCLFVDDRATNVEAAREVGMDAVVFEDAAQLRRALEARGLM